MKKPAKNLGDGVGRAGPVTRIPAHGVPTTKLECSEYKVKWRMSDPIIDLQAWLTTPPGRYLCDWEQRQYDQTVADLFGYHALQLGLPALAGLQNNRMPHQWLAQDTLLVQSPGGAPQTALVTDFAALPFATNSLDLVLLPHTLELGTDPHGCLREVERVLVPEGRVVISGLNPASLWGLRQRRAHWYRKFVHGHWGRVELFLPQSAEFIGFWRLRDWLHLLSFEVESSRFGCYRPALQHQAWLDRFGWMDRLGTRWWPILGAVYFVVATKKVRGMRLLSPAWKPAAHLGRAQVPVANRSQRQGFAQTDDLF